MVRGRYDGRRKVRDATLLALKMEDGPQAKAPLEAGERKAVDSPLEPAEGTRPYPHLDFSAVRPMSDVCKITNVCCIKPLGFW